MKSAELLIKALEQEGVQYIFGVPGEENLDVLEALRTSKIQTVVTRHEQAAGFMAATVGRLTGKIGLCLSTLGPGATNFTTAAAYATLGGFPMLMITGQKPIKKSKQGRFQIIPVVDMMKPITRYASSIKEGYEVAEAVVAALDAAEHERPGATHLELPEDIAAEMVEGAPLKRQPEARAKATEESLKKAAELLMNAKSPLLCIGGGASRKPECSAAIATFLKKTGFYFFETQMGKGVIDERSDHYLGTAALSANDFVHCAANRADVILCVGHDPIEKPPFFMKEGGATVIHLNFQDVLKDLVYFPQQAVLGDVADAITRLTAMLKPSTSWNFEYFEKVRKASMEALNDCAEDGAFPVKPQRIVAEVRKAMPEDGMLCLDNGMYKLWFARHYKAYLPHTILLDNALATMGAGLPSAMAAKMVFPKRKVVAVCGDGGFMMNSQEIETALRLKLDLVVLILNDSGYGMIRWKQDAQGLPSFGLTFENPDFKKYAESYGAKGYRLEKTEDLAALLQKVLNEPGVHVVEIPIDYSENDRVFTQGLKKDICPA